MSEHEQSPEVTRVEFTPGEPTGEPKLPSEEGTKEPLLAGKYKSVEELEKGYTELVKKLGAKEKPAEEKPATTPGTIPDAVAEKAVSKAGLDMAKLTSEYAEKGELSEESLQALENIGIPPEVVADYVAGQEARAAAQVAKIHSLVGGEAEYKSMLTWASTNLDAADIAAYNKAMTGDYNTQKLMVESLQGKFLKAVGSGAALLKGDSGAVPTASGYESRAQMVADMKDKRYRTDPAFRAKVEAKIAASRNI